MKTAACRPARLSAEELVPLQVWVTEHDVPPADLIDRTGEVLLSLPVRIGRLEMEYPAS